MDQLIPALNIVYASIADSQIQWALTGSLAFRIRGIDISVEDIDIQTDKKGAYEIERRLEKFVVEPVQFRPSQKIRSYFGKLRIDGVSVEIMGGIEKLTPDGSWYPTPPLQSIIEYLTFDDMRLPVLKIEYEYQAYLMMGRFDKAEALSKWLADHRT